MPTEYFCATCKTTFLDDDPAPIRGGAPIYGDCPNSPMARYFARIWLPEDERDLPDDIMVLMEDSERAHPVTLAASREVPPPKTTTVPKQTTPPPVNGANLWSSFKVKPLTKEEKERLAREAEESRKEQVRLRNQSEARRLAQQLLGRIDRMIEGGSYTYSSQFPMDREYGFKPGGSQLTASRATIKLAAQAWTARPDTSFRGPAWKRNWEQFQANFEQLIEPGQPSRGKHNVHVVAND